MRSDLDGGDTVRIEGFDYPDYPAIALLYARAVVSGRASACNLIKLACQRYIDMLSAEYQTAGDPVDHFYFSPEHAIEACAFQESLHHVKGTKAGENFILEPWQIWLYCAIYGFRWRSNGLRCVNQVYLEVPRKHGKSLMGAGIGNYEVTVNAGIGDDCFIIAPKFAQGLKVLEPMSKMVKWNDDLRDHFRIKSTQKSMNVRATDSQVIVLASLGEKEDGHDPKTVIADEFHAVPADIYKVMKSAQRARPESMFLQIGSAGRFTFGVGWEEHTAMVKMLESKERRVNVFAAIYTVDAGDEREWWTERVIRKANPGLGVSVDLRKTMQEAAEARKSPTDKVEFLRTALNLWGYNEAILFPKENWDRAARPTLKMEQCKGLKGWIGLDLASRNDMIAMVALFESPIAGKLVKDAEGDLVPDVDLYAFAFHYVPETGEWIKDDELLGPYRHWSEEGHLRFTRGSRHRYGELKTVLFTLLDEYDIEAVVIDDHEANEFYSALQDEGKPVVAYRKNATNHSDPTKDIMARVNGEEQSFFHDGNPVLAWNMQNVIGGPDTADRILGKKVTPNSNQKIDGFDALVQANAARLQSLAEKKSPNPMITRGMRIL